MRRLGECHGGRRNPRYSQSSRLVAIRVPVDIATNRRDEQELSVLCLRILQAALVYVNTLMVQDVLADPTWADRLTAEDRRGLTPLFWAHVAPYDEVRLDMGRRLPLHGAPAASAAAW